MDISYVLVSEIRLHPTFSNLFPKSLPVLYGLKKHIRDNGFDEAFPLILAYGPWTQHDVLIDGHCRRQVCAELGIEKVPVVRRYFETEDEAIEYMIHVQKDRRNLTDSEILNCLTVLDAKKKRGRPGKLAPRGALPDDGKSAEKTAEVLGISTRKVERVRTVSAHGDEEMKRDIGSGEKSINKAYQEIQEQRKRERTERKPQPEGSTMNISALPEPVALIEGIEIMDAQEDIEHETILGLSSEANDRVEDVTKAECWAVEIISDFDPCSIDYVIVGQETPNASVNGSQQVFVAPWIATTQGESIGPAEDAADQEASTPTPPQKPSVVNLQNYDEEGWYELEKQWAKFIPGFVPEPPEGTDAATVVEETSVEENPASVTEKSKSSPESEVQDVDAALEKIIASLEMGHGQGTRLEKWAKRYGVTVYTFSDNTRKIDRQRFFSLVRSIKDLNYILKGPVNPKYSWFPRTFRQICHENGFDVPAPDYADGFEVNLLLDLLCSKGIYSGGDHHPQDLQSLTKKLKFLVESWTEVCAGAKEYGFVQDQPDSPSFEWLVRYGETVFTCVHNKMQAIEEFEFDQIFGAA